jgi:hypothetical protein
LERTRKGASKKSIALRAALAVIENRNAEALCLLGEVASDAGAGEND